MQRAGLSFAALLLLVTFTAAQQYTPDPADWSTFATKPMAGSNTGHDPDGVTWISSQTWTNAQWDGTIYNPSQMSRADFTAAVCPTGDVIRGIREVFYAAAPFADNANPTKEEVDEWHRIALNHVRALVGYTSPERLVQKDTCMFARALWGQQRRFSTQWDTAYPGTTGSAYGPCQGSNNAHCGATFIPSPEDQVPYLPAGHPPCSTGAGSEGVTSAPKSNIPWSIKWSRAFCGFLGSEGFWGGHVGPFFHREKFGFSFWDNDPNNNNNNAVLRAKWTGALRPSLYCNPTDPTCDPANTGVALGGGGYVADECNGNRRNIAEGCPPDETTAPAPETTEAPPATTTPTPETSVPGPTPAPLVQYTPNQANWDTFQSKPLAVSSITAHDPNSIGWISQSSWSNAEWDGTVYNPSAMSKSDFAKAICPSVDVIRGIREAFYEAAPFADNENPTKEEVDEWHRIAINHVRALVGYTSPERQIEKDTCLFARSLWGQERRYTSTWNTYGSSCWASCQKNFLPSAEDQAAYLPEGHPECTSADDTWADREIKYSWLKSNIPWSVKWSRGFCATLSSGGFWHPNVEAFFHAKKFGMSFWDTSLSNSGSNTQWRSKWAGGMTENVWCNPADANCDPNNTGDSGDSGNTGLEVGAGCAAAGVSAAAGYYLYLRNKAKEELLAKQAGPPRLVACTESGEQLAEIKLEEGKEVTLGRGQEPPCQLAHDSCSSAHATLRLDKAKEGGWTLTITDLSSSNGTKVDGAPLEAHTPTPLQNGSNVSFGVDPTRWVVKLPGQGAVEEIAPELVVDLQEGPPRAAADAPGKVHVRRISAEEAAELTHARRLSTEEVERLGLAPQPATMV